MNDHYLDLTTDLLCFTLMGLNDETLHSFQAGYYAGDNGPLKHCLVVRLHDHDGQPLGYMGQSLQQWIRAPYGAWKMPQDLVKPPPVFNGYRVGIGFQAHRPLLVTSSPWAVMKLFQAGYRQVLSLIRLTINPETIRQIDRFRAEKVCLFLGGDKGCIVAAQWLEQHLKTPTHIIFLPKDASPEQLSEMELKYYLDPYGATNRQ
jgi:hypothetical protein